MVQTKTVRLKELALYVASKGNLHAKIVKIERLFLQQTICFVAMGKIIVKLLKEASPILTYAANLYTVSSTLFQSLTHDSLR